MANPISDSPRGMVETHTARNPRLQLFYVLLGLGIGVLAAGICFQQLFRSDLAHEKAKIQSQRRIVVPGPRGDIYDREGRLLVGNRPRFSVVLALDELRSEIWREYLAIRKAYRESDDEKLSSSTQLSEIARFTVVERYLDEINRYLGREAELDARDLRRHFNAQRLLPFTLIDDLEPDEYARLLEQLPVNYPVQVFTTSTRYYPYGRAAAHVLGYVSVNRDITVDDELPGSDLMTFKMAGSNGRNGLEAQFDAQLQGQPGGTIYRVDPGGYRVESLSRTLPVQGENLVSSLDIDLQIVAETRMREYEMAGAAVALDANTGEVLVMASLPGYELNDFTPHLTQATATDLTERKAWQNRALQGIYPPGSDFKILVTVAGMRAGVINAASQWNCSGYYRVGNRLFPCHDGHAHGLIPLHTAIAKSCNVFFFHHGIEMGIQPIADEARRFGFGSLTGIELPHETHSTLVPDPAWKRERRGARWTDGDTANVSIGQGDMLVSPLQMAAFTASVARGQTRTVPSIVHDPGRPAQRTPPIGLSVADYQALLQGMEEVTSMEAGGTARTAFDLRSTRIPGLRVAGKTGTAQQRTPEGTINFAWFICFAPIERPQVAIAVVIEGDTPGEETGGGSFAAPVARDILAKWAQKHPDLIPAPTAPAP